MGSGGRGSFRVRVQFPVVPHVVDDGTMFPLASCKIHVSTVECGLRARGDHRCLGDWNVTSLEY